MTVMYASALLSVLSKTDTVACGVTLFGTEQAVLPFLVMHVCEPAEGTRGTTHSLGEGLSKVDIG